MEQRRIVLRSDRRFGSVAAGGRLGAAPASLPGAEDIEEVLRHRLVDDLAAELTKLLD